MTEEEIEKKTQEEDAKPEEERDYNFSRTKTESQKVWEWTLLNTNKAIWLRDKDELTEEDYQNFYKSLSNDQSPALAYSHFKGEGEVEFNSILFIPENVSWDLMGEMSDKSKNLKLYVRRVLIQDTFVDLLPRYLNFLYGIIDSDDLPLNVNREALQQSKLLKAISKKAVKKFLDMVTELQKDEVKYRKFWQKYGKNMKYGIVNDHTNQ